jgi:hypothetical protein
VAAPDVPQAWVSATESYDTSASYATLASLASQLP